MIKKVKCTYVIYLILVSVVIYSQSVQAQISLSQDTIENYQKQAKKPKLPSRGAPTGRRRAGTGRNPECPTSLTRLTALLPGDGNKSLLASTVTPEPTFWFYVPELPETARGAELVLNERDGRKVKTVYRKPFALSGKAGIISINPSLKSEYSLEENKIYHWYFHIYCGDTQAKSDNFYVDGFMQKKALTQALLSQLKRAKPREYVVYNDNEIWYDALTNLG